MSDDFVRLDDDNWKKGGEGTPCIFHNKEYPYHDFYYGEMCRRCGVVRLDPLKVPLPPLHVDEELITAWESAPPKEGGGSVYRVLTKVKDRITRFVRLDNTEDK